MRNAIPVLPAILVLTMGGYSSADELSDAAQGLCDTIRTCALEAVAGQDLTDELREKMTPTLDNACDSMRNQVQAVPIDHKLYQPAVGLPAQHGVAYLSAVTQCRRGEDA